MSALFINLASFVNLFRKKILKINQFISIFVVIVFVFFALRSSFITIRRLFAVSLIISRLYGKFSYLSTQRTLPGYFKC